MPAFTWGRLIALIVFVVAVLALFGGFPVPVLLLIAALAVAIMIG